MLCIVCINNVILYTKTTLLPSSSVAFPVVDVVVAVFFLVVFLIINEININETQTQTRAARETQTYAETRSRLLPGSLQLKIDVKPQIPPEVCVVM